MHFDVLLQRSLVFVSFAAVVALEWSFPSVFPLVALQSIRSSTGVAALVTFEWLLSCVLSHHVKFQVTSSIARIIARCARVCFFTRVPLDVRFEVKR